MMMKKENSGIYVLEFDNYFYIGCSSHLLRRKYEHKSTLKSNKHSNPKMQNVFNAGNKYYFRILEYCEIEELEILEQKWFRWYSDLNPDKEPLNLKDCGVCPTYSYEAKVRISKGKIKKEYNFEQKYTLYDADTDELLYVGDIFEVSKTSNVSISELITLKKAYSNVFNTYVYMIEVLEFLPLDEQITINDIY